jgi:hypothetical protein
LWSEVAACGHFSVVEDAAAFAAALFQRFVGFQMRAFGIIPGMPIALHQLPDDIDALKARPKSATPRQRLMRPMLGTAAWVGMGFGLASYDQRTRERVLAQVAEDVPLGSDAAVMEAFMRKHAEAYSVDDRFNHRYAGLLPQSRLDRFLANRKVIVRLRFDTNRQFNGAEVLVAYQTL